MKLLRRNVENKPVKREEVYSLSDWFDRFFGEETFLTGFDKTGWNPKVDIVEKDSQMFVKADIPGLEEKDLNVEIRDNTLTISGKKEDEKETKDGNFIRLERSSGSFSRTIPLPEGVEAEKIKAQYRKGVLEIVIPKTPAPESRKISVKVS